MYGCLICNKDEIQGSTERVVFSMNGGKFIWYLYGAKTHLSPVCCQLLKGPPLNLLIKETKFIKSMFDKIQRKHLGLWNLELSD